MSQNESSNDDIERLLESANSGNRQAFEEIFARFQPYLTKVITLRMPNRLRKRKDPEEIVQEAFLHSFERLSDFMDRRPMPFRLWLRGNAVERLVQDQRHHSSQKKDMNREVGLPEESGFALVEKLFGVSTSPSQKVEKAETIEKILESLNLLEEDDREILVLRILEEHSNMEAAQILSITPDAASQRYVRALKKIRKIVNEIGLLEE